VGGDRKGSTSVLHSEDFGPEQRQSQFELGRDGPSTIVTGVDGSRTALRAAAYAAGLARRQSSRLVVVFVATRPPMEGMSMGPAPLSVQELFGETIAELRAEIERRHRELGIPITFEVRLGDPFTELKQAAADARADVVVVGASESAGHRLIGSLAGRLVRAGRWPVTVVP
jgi:nucleotide-binding universal stress UspA family protein